MRLATTATRDGDHWIINGAKDCIANAPDRQADRGRGADRQGRGAVPGAARHAGPHGHRAARAALVSRLLRPAFAEGCPGAGRKSARASAARPTPAAPPRSPRRSISASAAPPTRPRWNTPGFACRAAAASSSIRRSAPSSPRSRSGSTSRAPPSGGRPGPRDHPGRLCRPQPARPAAHHHRQGVHRRDDLSRREGRRRMLRRHGRDARHAAAEIHPRRADLPAHRRRQRRRQAAHRRGAGRTTGARNRCSPRNRGTHHGLFTEQRAAQLADDGAQVRRGGDQADHARSRRGARRARHLRLGHRREGIASSASAPWRCRRNSAAKAPTTSPRRW